VIEAMPRPRPPHVHRQETRHGRVVWYFRRGKGPRIRLPGPPGSDGFDAAYEAALRGGDVRPHSAAGRGTLAWLIDRYRESTAWADLSLATRRQRETILRQVVASAGAEPATAITRAVVVAGRDRRRETPAQARHFLDTLKGLFRWAAESQIVETDPTLGVRPPKAPRTGGFAAWTDDDVAAFTARWPVGTRARVALDLLRYTGLRRGDAVRLGRQHLRGGVFRLATAKTGAVVTITLLPALEATLAAGPTGDLAYICGERGQPMTKEAFGNIFREWCVAAGVTKSAHGLRKLAATTMAEAGATVTELESVFGWSGGGMASLYTRSANRAKVGQTASRLLAGTPAEHPIPSPHGQIPSPEKLTK